MPLPTTGFGTATATNPSSALTDFTFMVDLSTMPADWWTENNSSDGTKGRAAKNADGTELATDWINFNSGAQTGWVRIKWSGTLAASGSQVVRIYPPHTSNSSNARTNTFGQDNAYNSDWKGYWPDGIDVDRTINQRTLTPASAGNPTVAGVVGQVAEGTQFDGVDDKGTNSSGPTDGVTEVTMMHWVFVDALPTGGARDSVMGTNSINNCFSRVVDTGNFDFVAGAVGQTARLAGVAISTGEWLHLGGFWKSGDAPTVFKNKAYTLGPSIVTGTTNSGSTFTVNGSLPGSSFGPQRLDECQVHVVELPTAWIDEEFDQTNSQATFWGTWVWNAVSGDVEVTPSPVVTTWAPVTPAITPGDIVVTPAPAIATWGTVAPTVTSLFVLTPAPALAAWAAATPTITKGAITLTPAPAVAVWSAPAPTLSEAVFLTPDPAVATWSVPKPTIDIEVTPAPVVVTWTTVLPIVRLIVEPTVGVGVALLLQQQVDARWLSQQK